MATVENQKLMEVALRIREMREISGMTEEEMEAVCTRLDTRLLAIVQRFRSIL